MASAHIRFILLMADVCLFFHVRQSHDFCFWLGIPTMVLVMVIDSLVPLKGIRQFQVRLFSIALRKYGSKSLLLEIYSRVEEL